SSTCWWRQAASPAMPRISRRCAFPRRSLPATSSPRALRGLRIMRSSRMDSRMSDTPSWRERLFGGFKRTSDRLGENLAGLFTKAALDEETLDEIEEALIVTDLGPAMAARIRERLAEGRFN